MDVELLLSLVCDWYGIKFPRFKEFDKFSEQHFATLWKHLWFAKMEQQQIADTYLQKYKPLFSITNPEEVKPEGIQGKEIEIFYKLGWLLLWDQISRNIFRNTNKAYETDKKARELVEELMPFWNILPLPIQITLILVYIHSEDINDVIRVKELMERVEVEMKTKFRSVWLPLQMIAQNHRDRMNSFGRIPERNKFLGRESTSSETAFLRQFCQ